MSRAKYTVSTLLVVSLLFAVPLLATFHDLYKVSLSASGDLVWEVEDPTFRPAQAGDPLELREPLMGEIDEFKAQLAGGSTEVDIVEMSYSTENTRVKVVRDENGEFGWTIEVLDQGTWQAVTLTACGPQECSNDGIPPEFLGSADSGEILVRTDEEQDAEAADYVVLQGKHDE